MKRHRVISVIGTRPEAIKMAPVIKELQRNSDIFEHSLLTTAQHREMLDQVLDVFGLIPTIDLKLMEPDQDLASFASRSLASISEKLSELKPDAVLIQGDTTTVMTCALAAFYQGIRVGHVEAGLRSFDPRNPFPEEINRRIAACLADLNFSPTDRARQNLIREGISDDRVFVTGNTIVDALQSIPLEGRFDDPKIDCIDFRSRRVILVTAHRRENHGAPLHSICQALKQLAASFEDVEIVYPVHLNPNVSEPVRKDLATHPRIHLLSPASYIDLLKIMKRCYMVLTDSGGIQEEAPSFHKPVLILREVTERPELVEVGAGTIVGTDSGRIFEEAARLLSDSNHYLKMSTTENPFGDGKAAKRIVSILADTLD